MLAATSSDSRLSVLARMDPGPFSYRGPIAPPTDRDDIRR